MEVLSLHVFRSEINESVLVFHYGVTLFLSNASMSEWVIPIPVGKEVECVVNRLREHYRNSKTASNSRNSEDATEIYKEQLRTQIRENDKSNKNDQEKGIEPSEKMIEVAADLQLVETVALLPGGVKTDYLHINMYCDDRAVSKGSSLNERACGIASICGLSSLQVRGDVFIGRVIEDDERFIRQDFTLKDLDSSAKWMETARDLNRLKQNDPGLARLQAMAGADQSQVIMQQQNHAMSSGQMEDAPGESPEGSVYTWSQNEDDVVIEVVCPNSTVAKDIKCLWGPQTLKLVIESFDDDKKTVLDGKLFQRIDVDGSTWTIESTKVGRVLQITLSKEKAMRWLVLLR